MADKLSNSLSDAIAIKTAELTVPSGVTKTTAVAHKCANVVTLYIIVNKSQWAESDLIATIPEGFRPSQTAYAQIVNYNSTSNNNVAGISGADGTVKVWSKGTQPAGNIYITVTYVI